jgi:4-hydroxybenzoate polyprenyltransferase
LKIFLANNYPALIKPKYSLNSRIQKADLLPKGGRLLGFTALFINCRESAVSVLKKIFDFFIFSSLYIAFIAVLMTYQTLHLLGDFNININLILFIFFSTICSYNFHWYLTTFSVASSNRVRWTQEHKVTHVILYFIGLGGAVFYFYLLREHWIAIALGALVTFLYSAPKLPQEIFKDLKKIAVGKTFFLAFVWTYVTTALPWLVYQAVWRIDFIGFMLNRFFLVYAICILFDYRDRDDDKQNNIKSFITYFSIKGIDNLFAAAIILCFISGISLHWYDYSWFSITILLVPPVIVALIYSYAKKNFSDYLYYFVLDGLMMLSPLMMLIFEI